MNDRAPQTQDKFIVRLPDGMRDRIKAAAEANNRSMNAEIVAVLEREYPEPEFDIGAFVNEWSPQFSRAGTLADARAVAERANLVLSESGSEWSVHVSGEDDAIRVSFETKPKF